jgi:hypothetical protein
LNKSLSERQKLEAQLTEINTVKEELALVHGPNCGLSTFEFGAGQTGTRREGV